MLFVIVFFRVFKWVEMFCGKFGRVSSSSCNSAICFLRFFMWFVVFILSWVSLFFSCFVVLFFLVFCLSKFFNCVILFIIGWSSKMFLLNRRFSSLFNFVVVVVVWVCILCVVVCVLSYFWWFCLNVFLVLRCFCCFSLV